jgi:hypothetical protein
MTQDIRSAHSSHSDARAAASDLAAQLAGEKPVVIAFFTSHRHDGQAISRYLKEAFPDAAVLGCTTAGELTQHVSTTGTTSLLALGRGKVRKAKAALARFDDGVGPGVARATSAIAAALDIDLRAADPERWVGITLVEGLRMKEEAVNHALGNTAPLLSFVGGSAGDDTEFVQTRVFCEGEASDDGAALLLLEAEVPFVVSKTCSFEPQSRKLQVTRVDLQNRIVYELDDRPAPEVYAEVLGLRPNQLDNQVFMVAPLGIMIDGEPWIRSPMRLWPDGGLKFYCQIPEGMEVQVMRSTDLVADTQREIARVRERLGGQVSGGFAFNCILRRLELDAKRLHGPFLESFAGLEMAGFHTYGESFLAHINQTLTGLWFR